MLLMVTAVPAYLPGSSQIRKSQSFTKGFLPRIHHAVVSRPVHSLSQSQFCTQCDLVRPLSNYSILS